MIDTAQRACPGFHTDTNPAPGLRDDEYLCRRCVDRTVHYLRDLLADLAELDNTAARQAVLGSSSGPRAKNDERPLPFHPTAAARRGEMEGWLYEWASFVAERRGRPLPRLDRSRLHMTRKRDPVARGGLGRLLNESYEPRFEWAALTRAERVAAVRSLLESRDWLRSDPQGPGLAESIATMRARSRATVDRYNHRWYAGPCGTPAEMVEVVETEDGQLSASVRKKPCEFDLYAEPGKAVIVCDGYRDPDGLSGCGAFHPAQTRHRQLIESLREQLLPLGMILAAMPSLLGARPDPNTVKGWKQRRKLRPVPGPWAGVALYRGGDVLDLVQDTKPRPGPKRRDTPARDLAEVQAEPPAAG